MIDDLKDLVRQARVITLDDECGQGRHRWVSDGGRGCPRISDAAVDCSQPVYRCDVCGTYDYGNPGGPGHADCLSARECVARDFDDWLADLDRISADADYVPNLVEQTGKGCWWDAFADGMTPQEAFDEEMHAASLGEGCEDERAHRRNHSPHRPAGR